MNNALLAIGALLIAILAALFGIPHLVDWNGYRGVFEEEATRVLGRDVRVGGGVSVRFLPVPYVRFERVRIADTANETGDPFFKTDSFTMWLSITPLMRGALEARDIELKRPVLRLVVDSQGGGNWTSLALKPGALPFVPSDVTLQSVRIDDGTIDIARKDGSALALVTGVGGELEADSLDGPFRFKGVAQWESAAREVRFVTAKADAAGAIRFKASVRVPAGIDNYLLDGRLADIKTRPRLDGQLTARIGLGAAPATPAKRGVAADAPSIEMKSAVLADGTGLKLGDLQLTFENVGQPQLAAGEAQMAWVSRPAMEVRLASRWLDLDRIGGAAAAEAPLGTVRGLVSSLFGLLPSEADSLVRFSVDQVNLGADSVSDLKVTLGRSKGPLEVREFTAGLPGGGRIDFTGTVTDQKAHAFGGSMLLRGSSLGRFLGWAAKGHSFAEGRADGPFLVQGRLAVSPTTLDLTAATAETAGNTLAGELHVAGGERRTVSLVVEGRKVDAVQLWPSELGNGRLEQLLTLGPAGDGASAGDAPAAKDVKSPPLKSAQSLLGGVPDTDLKVRLRAGELVAGARVLRDVDADFAIERGALTLPLVRFTTEDGASAELEGSLAAVAERPKGQLRWVASASSPPAIATLLQLSGIAARDAVEVSRLQAFAPLRLAGVAAFGARNDHSYDVTLDGLAAGGRVRASARLDAGRTAWRKAAAEFSATLDDADLTGVMRLISTTSAAALDKAAMPRRGHVFVKAAGVGETGLVTLATLSGEGLAVAYEGRVESPAAAAAALDGRLRFMAKDTRSMLALAGIAGSARLGATAIEGVGTLTRKAETIEFGAERLTIGGSNAKGALRFTRRKDKPTLVDADLAVDHASVQGLLAGLSEPASPAAAPAEARTVWSDEPFDLSAFSGIEGALKLKFARLTLEPGLALVDAALDAKVEPGRIDLSKLEAAALGGKLTARLALAKVAAGVSLDGGLKLDGVKLEALASAGGRPLTGAATVSATFAGQSMSAGTLVGALKGKGEIALGEAQIGGFRAAPVAAVAEAAIEGKGEREGEGLAKVLRDAALQGVTKLGPRKIPIEIADGAARIGEIAVDGPEGRTTLATTVDLSQLKFDAEWKLEPRIVKNAAVRAERVNLPAVSVVYVGLLKDVATVEPRWSAGGFERELAVRKMERDVEELERLRKLDEERAARERERLEAIEAEKRRAAEQAAAAAAAEAAAAVPSAAVPTDAGDGKATVPPFAAPTVKPAEGATPAAAPAAEPVPPAPRPAESRRRTQRLGPADAPPSGSKGG